ncbi:MAG: NUDIX hydrolase [Actinobacteria bacterium]|nr:NUDIX hydrolase [Actinomycetota bacterium]
MSEHTSDRFDPALVPVSPAATVMLVRDAIDGPAGTEVFMMRRTAKASFGAGMYVFPGGRVDVEDGATDIAPYCQGLDDAEASAKLGIDSGGLAYWVAAIRECFEEAGVLLAQSRLGGALQLRNEDRHAVHDGSLSVVELCRRDDLVLDLSTTHYVDHWITPMGERRRFDTRFFLTEAPADQEPLHDDKETVDSLWVRPADALRMQQEGELMMMPPTIANLRFLLPHDSTDAALAAGAGVENPVCVLPKLRRNEDGRIIGVAMPGDPDYDDLA